MATATPEAPTKAPVKKDAPKAPAKQEATVETATAAPKTATEAKDAVSAPPKAKTPADWLKELEAVKGAKLESQNEKYPEMTNAQVLAVLRYQVARKDSGAKATDDVPEALGVLLRAACRAYPALLDTSLSASEKKALGTFTESELSDEEKGRLADPAKKGLSGKARFLWVTQGLDSKAQVAAGKAADKAAGKDKAGKEPKAKKESAPKDPTGQRLRKLDEKEGRWSEGAFEKLAATSEGIIVMAITDRKKGTMRMIGQLPPAPAFYDHIKPAIEAQGLDPEKVELVTISARFGYTNRPEKQEERYRPPMIGVAPAPASAA